MRDSGVMVVSWKFMSRCETSMTSHKFTRPVPVEKAIFAVLWWKGLRNDAERSEREIWGEQSFVLQLLEEMD